MVAVGAVAGLFVVARVLGEAGDVAGVGAHGEQVEDVALVAGGEGDGVTPRGPGGGLVVVALEGEALLARAVGVHHVDLGAAAPGAHEGDALAVGGEAGRGVDTPGVGQLPGVAAVGVRHPDLRVPAAGVGVGDAAPVGGEGDAGVHGLAAAGDQPRDVPREAHGVELGVAGPVGGVGDAASVRCPGREEVEAAAGEPVGPVAVPVADPDLLALAHPADEGDGGVEDPPLPGEVLHHVVGAAVGEHPGVGHRRGVGPVGALFGLGDVEEVGLVGGDPVLHRDPTLEQALGADVGPGGELDAGGVEALAGGGEERPGVEDLEHPADVEVVAQPGGHQVGDLGRGVPLGEHPGDGQRVGPEGGTGDVDVDPVGPGRPGGGEAEDEGEGGEEGYASHGKPGSWDQSLNFTPRPSVMNLSRQPLGGGGRGLEAAMARRRASSNCAFPELFSMTVRVMCPSGAT